MKSRKRHIAKTITWRVVATTTTFILAMIFFKEDTNATQKAGVVALIETILKMVLYYYHERAWFNYQTKLESAIRHIMKTLTWRVIASVTTFIVTFIVFRDDPGVVQKATGVALIESLLKMILYYLHERFWHKSKFGLDG